MKRVVSILFLMLLSQAAFAEFSLDQKYLSSADELPDYAHDGTFIAYQSSRTAGVYTVGKNTGTDIILNSEGDNVNMRMAFSEMLPLSWNVRLRGDMKGVTVSWHKGDRLETLLKRVSDRGNARFYVDYRRELLLVDYLDVSGRERGLDYKSIGSRLTYFVPFADGKSDSSYADRKALEIAAENINEGLGSIKRITVEGVSHSRRKANKTLAKARSETVKSLLEKETPAYLLAESSVSLRDNAPYTKTGVNIIVQYFGLDQSGKAKRVDSSLLAQSSIYDHLIKFSPNSEIQFSNDELITLENISRMREVNRERIVLSGYSMSFDGSANHKKAQRYVHEVQEKLLSHGIPAETIESHLFVKSYAHSDRELNNGVGIAISRHGDESVALQETSDFDVCGTVELVEGSLRNNVIRVIELCGYSMGEWSFGSGEFMEDWELSRRISIETEGGIQAVLDAIKENFRIQGFIRSEDGAIDFYPRGN